jgi:hypothetical protein
MEEAGKEEATTLPCRTVKKKTEQKHDVASARSAAGRGGCDGIQRRASDQKEQ